MMIEKGEPIHSVVWFDTGWEFPEMIEHVNKLESYLGIKFVRLKPKQSFDYLLKHHPVKANKGENKGNIYGYGYGWPNAMRRWCTGRKIDTIKKYLKTQNNFISCIGLAADEGKRIPININKKWPERYPLIEYDISEVEALQYCYGKGFDWGGLYELFGRVSCFCCPLQRINDLRILRKYRPDLWIRMLKMNINKSRSFKNNRTLDDLDKRFAEEDRQLKFS